MEIHTAKLKLRFEFIYFALYGTMACYFPFLALYFESRGLSYTQIGIAFAVNSLVGIIAQPVWGYITDKYLNKKKTLLIASICCSVLIFNLVFAHSFLYVLLSIIFLLVFQSITSPISDAYCYDILEHTGSFHFGDVRFAGSVGFAVVSAMLGYLIEYTGLNTCYFLYSAFFLLYAYLLWGLRFEGKNNIKRPAVGDILNLVRQPGFMLFVLSVMLLNISLGANSSYLAIIVQHIGGSTSALGFIWFVIAMSELPAFFIGGMLFKKYGELNVYLAAALMYIVRFYLCSFEQGYTTVIIIQLLQSVTFPLYLMGAMQHLQKIVPDQIRASGITILSSLGFGLGNFIGNLGGGVLLENRNVFFLYRSMALACTAALTVGLLLKLYEKSKKIKAPIN